MSKVLLTGVTGFLGSHLAKALLAEGYEVLALKRRSSSLRRIESIAGRMKIYDVEDIDFDKFFSEFNGIQAIIHTATCYGRNGESVSEIFSSNTEFPLMLLDMGARANVEIFLNTDTILDKYLNLYSLSKNQLLQWGTLFSKQGKIRFANIRLEHFYGPDDDLSKFTAFIIHSCKENVPEIRLTLGEQQRDFVYIDDVVSAYIRILQNIEKTEEPFAEFDVGSGHSVTIREFVETVRDLTTSKTRLEFGAIPYRDGEVMKSVADITPLLKFGWKCKYDVRTGIEKVLELENLK